MTRILAVYPAAIATLLLTLPLIAPRSGPLTLANIFSVHLALAGLLLVPVALRTSDVVLRGSLAALLVVAVVRFGGEWVSVPPSDDTSDGLFATASWNLELGARDGTAAADAIATIGVDLIALQELGPDHARAIEPLTRSRACTRTGRCTRSQVSSGWDCCRTFRSFEPNTDRTRPSSRP